MVSSDCYGRMISTYNICLNHKEEELLRWYAEQRWPDDDIFRISYSWSVTTRLSSREDHTPDASPYQVRIPVVLCQSSCSEMQTYTILPWNRVDNGNSDQEANLVEIKLGQQWLQDDC